MDVYSCLCLDASRRVPIINSLPCNSCASDPEIGGEEVMNFCEGCGLPAAIMEYRTRSEEKSAHEQRTAEFPRIGQPAARRPPRRRRGSGPPALAALFPTTGATRRRPALGRRAV